MMGLLGFEDDAKCIIGYKAVIKKSKGYVQEENDRKKSSPIG